MRSRWRPVARLLALLAVVWARGAGADPAEVTAGALRTPIQRAGTVLRSEPRMGAEVLGNVAHGTRLMVEEAKAGWLRVTSKVADGSSKTGWVRANETVEPYALTEKGRTVGAPVANRSAGELSAASRGFSEEIEKALVTSQAQLQAAYRLLDERVEGVKPSPSEVETFAKQGRLGFPGRTR